MSDLIFDIEKFVTDFKLKSVKLFVPKTYTLYSLAGASALAAYVNRVCKIPTTLVANEEKVEEITMCLPLVEDPRWIKKNQNDFLAIIIDCPSVEDCDNDAYNRTFCALEIRGKVSMKDFGAEAYNDSDALCAAEIIFSAIQKHSELYSLYCKDAYDYLYLAMLDATAVSKLHMKTNTFEAIQEIINNGAEINIKPECFKQKEAKEIEILENIYVNCRINNQVGYVIFNEERWNKYKADDFQNTLEYIRYVKLVDVWIAFVKTKKGYIMYGQGNAAGKFDITKTYRNYGAVGTRKKSKCKIKEEQINEILDVAYKMVADGKLKEKPRKKYTHKVKKSSN